MLLLRHGQSTWNAEGRWQGWSDPPLSDLGRAQAREAGRRLGGAGVTGIVASDLTRARDSADILVAALDASHRVHIDPDLREYDVGDWEGLLREEIERGWPEELAEWRQGRLRQTPGGEARAQFDDRVRAALARVAGQQALGDAPVVVTHGGVIRAAEQLSGAERSASVGNLAGRWFLVDARGSMVAGELVNLLDPSQETVPPSL
jgi:probable phosphoglycerate mutase